MMTAPLFEPLQLQNGRRLKNRFAKPAMSEVLATKDHRPTPALINLYRQWAQGGSGLLITGNVMVDPTALGEAGTVVIEDTRHLEALENWAEAGSQNGAQTWVQLNHPGRQAPKHVTPHPVAPSAVPLTGENAFAFNPPRALSEGEIHQLVQRFANAAGIVKQAGFGGVEIHAAHGYLISQFLSPRANRRTDAYGGDLTNRMRFLMEVYLAMRARVGADFPIGLKINSADYQTGGFSQEDSIAVIQRMAQAGVDLIEISGGNYENTMVQGANTTGAFFIDYAAKAKQGLTVPFLVTGGFRSYSGMTNAVLHHETELVGLARGLALVFDLPNRAAAGQFETLDLDMLTTGIPALDQKLGSYIGLSYYQMQMRRIAMGRPVRRTKNAWQALAYALRTQGKAAMLPARA